ncbi:hypothetical protein PN437_05420 [Microcystis aeruginosa CS-564/01]|nr:hypothetical protein [Microcystis aeruginosa CS-564/01]
MVIISLKQRLLALLGLVGKMYSKIQFGQRVEGTTPDTEDTKIDRFYS